MYLEARKMLREEGIEAFNLEARLILEAASEKTRERWFKDMQLYVTDGFEEKVGRMLRRRIEGEPVAYITGEWEFYGLPMSVSEDVLIPRVDTEVLVDAAVEMISGRESGTRVLDLCSGSGCIGIAISSKVPGSRVVLVDNSIKALRVSRANILKNNMTRNITCVEADVMEMPPMLLGSFDVIVCNPPYIPSGDIKRLDKSVRNFEPVHALDGGISGLDFFRIISSKWKSVLNHDGKLLFECGIGQSQSVSEILAENGFTDIKVFKDSLDIERVVTGTKK